MCIFIVLILMVDPSGIRLHPVVIAGSEASSDEMSSAESTYLSGEDITTQ